MKLDKRVRVLVVDDDLLVSEMIQGLLEEIGYTVIGRAANGLQAVEMTQSLRPDVVLTDIRMPDMDGIEAAQKIQELCPTPVVVLTAHETPELLARATAAGIGAYLVKPPNLLEMERAITVAMARFADLMALRRLNEDLDAYAHSVAHDLKNPLSVISGVACLLLDEEEEVSPEDLIGYLGMIEHNARKMQGIIDGLLLLAEARNLEVSGEPLDMGGIVDEARRRLSDMIAAHEAEITVPDTWPIAQGYAPWIEQVWCNYLSNAIKYGGQPPVIELGYTNQNSSIRFWVRDNGPGIPPADHVRLFKPFTRLHRRDVEGHGLGLAIVHRIMEKLGGEAGVDSDGRSGSVFYFTLPVANGQRAAGLDAPQSIPVKGSPEPRTSA